LGARPQETRRPSPKRPPEVSGPFLPIGEPHMPSLPTGTVTFLFTDIEGSTLITPLDELQRTGSPYPSE